VEEQTQREEKEKLHNQDVVTVKAYKIRKLQYHLTRKFKVVRDRVGREKVIEPSPNEIRKMTRLFYEYDFMGALDPFDIGFLEDRLDRINPKRKLRDEQLDYEDRVNGYGVSESEAFRDDNRGDLDYND
jgi:hypothetical protein